MVGWLIGWLDGWLIGWLVGWLVGWLAGWLAGWLVGWLVGWLIVQATRSEAPRSRDVVPSRNAPFRPVELRIVLEIASKTCYQVMFSPPRDIISCADVSPTAGCLNPTP